MGSLELKSFGVGLRPVSVLFCCCHSGSERLLWSSHIRAAVPAGPLYPHQLDGPRRKRLVFLLQRVARRTAAYTSNKNAANAECAKEDMLHIPPVEHPYHIILTRKLISATFCDTSYSNCRIHFATLSDLGRGPPVLTLDLS